MTFLTAGFPHAKDTVPLMLAMQEGGADIIELGMPFSDPIADGPAIQESNTVSATPLSALYVRFEANPNSDSVKQRRRVRGVP